jgi:hypothetical protein
MVGTLLLFALLTVALACTCVDPDCESDCNCNVCATPWWKSLLIGLGAFVGALIFVLAVYKFWCQPHRRYQEAQIGVDF